MYKNILLFFRRKIWYTIFYMKLLAYIINITGGSFMKTIRVKTLFFSLLCSTAISFIIFSSEEEAPAYLTNYPHTNSRKLIEYDDVTRMKQAITSPEVNIDDKDNENGDTPLMYALKHNNWKKAKLLIESRANVHEQNNSGVTALDLIQSLTTVGLLLKIQFYIDNPQKNIKLIQKQTSDVKDSTYIANNENQKMRYPYSDTELIHATKLGLSETVKLLIKNCANVDQQAYEDGPTPLAIAASNGHLKITKLLLAGEASLDKAIQNNRTPLMFAAGHGHSEIVKLLLENNADPHKCDDDGYTASRFAAKSGNSTIVELLTCEESEH